MDKTYKIGEVLYGQLKGKYCKVLIDGFAVDFPNTSYRVHYYVDKECTLPLMEYGSPSMGLIQRDWVNIIEAS